MLLRRGGVLEVSGVLAVVTMGVLLAATFWPLVCSVPRWRTCGTRSSGCSTRSSSSSPGSSSAARSYPTSLAAAVAATAGDASDHGRLLGAAAAVNGSGAAGAAPTTSTCSATDLLWALLTYVACIAVRGLVVLILFPLLRRLGYGMPASDGLVVAWGGLHGSVGLALAMSMDHSLRGAGRDAEGKQVLLHVAMVAVLTLTVNAPSMAPLLRSVGLTSSSEEQDHCVCRPRARISDYAWREYHRMLSRPSAALPENEKWLRAIPTWVRLMALTKDDHEGEERRMPRRCKWAAASWRRRRRRRRRRAPAAADAARVACRASHASPQWRATAATRAASATSATTTRATTRPSFATCTTASITRRSASARACPPAWAAPPSLEAGSAAAPAAEAEKQPFRHTKHQGMEADEAGRCLFQAASSAAAAAAGGSRATMRRG